jgi:hypothetical protein
MTGPELQSRIVRRVEAYFDQAAATYCKAGIDPARAHEQALSDALRLLSEALEELRNRGLFPFPEGEVQIPKSAAGGSVD